MLSNPANNLHQRQRQHRRQNSTPSAFDATKVPLLPKLQRHASHRRGSSLDQRQPLRSPQEQSVSITNQGLQQTQQHLLREAQQHRPLGPGRLHHQVVNDNYLASPQNSPLRQSFDAASINPYPGPVNTIIKVDPTNYSQNLGASDFSLFDGEFPTPSAYLDFPVSYQTQMNNQNWGANSNNTTTSTRPRRISDGIASTVAKYEDLGSEPTRPLTPSNLQSSSYFPLTPATTPYNRSKQTNIVLQSPFSETFQDEDVNMETIKPIRNRRIVQNEDVAMETVKPIRNRSNQRTRTNFDEMRQDAQSPKVPSPPGTAPLPSKSAFDSAPMPGPSYMNMGNLSMEFRSPGGAAYESSFYSPTTSNFSAQMSQPSSPQISQRMPHLSDPFSSRSTMSAPMSANLSSEGRKNSVQSGSSARPAASPRSVENINLEETITDTGVTTEEISNYIHGPDASDGKWVCLYPSCAKRFGRKENIKSHVQTHLGDRQFQCPSCQKCFVRQHDLKRHLKIHSGFKPYDCACGNSFARHDALTRHRQRGMCVGAFEGIVKKVVKRGRPRKNRPDDEKRAEKSNRTRSKNKAMSSSSSTSDYSEDSSFSPSPPRDIAILDDQPFGNVSQFTASTASYISASSFQYSEADSSMNAADYNLPMTNGNDYVSPQQIQSATSPAAMSSQSHTHSTHSRNRHSVTSMPQQSNTPRTPHSNYNTPPELVLSSSPAPSTGATPYLDFDQLRPSSQHSNASFSHTVSSPDYLSPRAFDRSQSSNHGMIDHLPTMPTMSMDEQDAIFMQSFPHGLDGDHGLPVLEQNPGLLLDGGKFEEDFNMGAMEMGNEMFRSDGVDINDMNDVFFGSP